MDKDLKKLLKKLEAQGHTIRYTRKGHPVVLHKDGIGRVTFSGTPSDHRSLLNAIAKLRKNGFDI